MDNFSVARLENLGSFEKEFFKISPQSLKHCLSSDHTLTNICQIETIFTLLKYVKLKLWNAQHMKTQDSIIYQTFKYSVIQLISTICQQKKILEKEKRKLYSSKALIQTIFQKFKLTLRKKVIRIHIRVKFPFLNSLGFFRVHIFIIFAFTNSTENNLNENYTYMTILLHNYM